MHSITHSTTADTREAQMKLLIADKNLKKKMKRGKNKTKRKQKQIVKRTKGKTDHTNRDTRGTPGNERKMKKRRDKKSDNHGRGGKKIRQAGTGAYRHAKLPRWHHVVVVVLTLTF